MKESRKKREQRTLSLSPEMRVNEVIETWPHTLNTLIKMGFGPLANPFLRKTIGRNVTIRQAANFRNIDLNILLANLETTIANPTVHSEALVDEDRLRFDENTVPELVGDSRVLGLIPCPIRNLLVDRFDAFVQERFSSKGKKVAWWLAAEGSGTGDVKTHLKSVVKSDQRGLFPDIFIAVGTELFMHEEYGRRMYLTSAFQPIARHPEARPELAALEDPGGRLRLQFAVAFSFYCLPEALGGVPPPRTWFDLTDAKYRDQIVVPALNLPVIPDFLAALYYYLGDSLFIKFAQNVAMAAHPAQSSSRKLRSKQPGIFITPLHFSKIMKTPGSLHIIPEDGMVAVPAFIARTSPPSDEANELLDYLVSREWLETYYRFGSFIPNRSDIPVDVPLQRLITRPWRLLIDNIPDDLHQQLLLHFKLEAS